MSSLSGVLVVDKPEGPTSHDVVTLARRALGAPRIGHTGTLDPLATGVLPLVIGRATRLAQFLTAGAKSYEATIAFGRSTDTHDAKGREIAACDRRPAREELDAALARFRGTFAQTPPAFSAKNIDGRRSYDLARTHLRRGGSSDPPGAVVFPGSSDPPGAGVPPGSSDPPRPRPVTVTVHQLELLSFTGDLATLRMTVTAGFYVRSLAHDLGERLGCGAFLLALRRTRSGEFGLASAVPLADVLRSTREDLATRLVPMADLLTDLPSVRLRGPASLERLKNGVAMGPADLATPFTADAAVVRLLTPEGDLAGLAKPAPTPGFLHGWIVLGP